MKIATWNLERPSISSAKRNAPILEALMEVNADIVVLTETNSIIDLGADYVSLRSELLQPLKETIYKDGENRTTIWSKYPAVKHVETYDAFTSVCMCVQTPHGNLNVYGTVIGILGSRNSSFIPDMQKQIEDWQRISGAGDVCVAGDFNISFFDSYYYTNFGRDRISSSFVDLKISNLTAMIPENIDHIAISESFVKTATCRTHVWNQDKKLSDHKGISITIEFPEV